MSIYAVNGKEPVSVWIPSLDTSGNGTTTLTDLVGSNDGTLTNMDAATDWPADTGAGGVRALDLDGSNDRVDLGQPISDYSAFTISGWFKPTSTSTTQYVVAQRGSESLGWYELMIRSGSVWRFEVKNQSGGEFNSPTISVSFGSWQHVVGVFTGTRVELYVDGTRAGTGTAYSGAIPAPTADAAIGVIAGGGSGSEYAGRVDDVRIFEDGLDSSDIAYLHNSGTGRGIVAASGAPAVNAQHNNLRNIRMAP